MLIISISSPIRLGVYENDILIKEIESEKKTSEILVHLLSELLKEYEVESVIYTNGPGSYMSTKLTYIILKSLEVVKDIPFYSCSAFACNGGNPIKAMGKLYFVLEGEKIVTEQYSEPIAQDFILPVTLHTLRLDSDARPNYILPAV